MRLFKRKKERPHEYSKRILDRIINHCILMMWATYILAWFDKTEIAESLSTTIAASIIAVVVGYFIKATFENISKYTTAFGENIEVATEYAEDPEEEPEE